MFCEASQACDAVTDVQVLCRWRIPRHLQPNAGFIYVQSCLLYRPYTVCAHVYVVTTSLCVASCCIAELVKERLVRFLQRFGYRYSRWRTSSRRLHSPECEGPNSMDSPPNEPVWPSERKHSSSPAKLHARFCGEPGNADRLLPPDQESDVLPLTQAYTYMACLQRSLGDAQFFLCQTASANCTHAS